MKLNMDHKGVHTLLLFISFLYPFHLCFLARLALCIAWIPSRPSPHLPHTYGVYLLSLVCTGCTVTSANVCMGVQLESRYDGAILTICLSLLRAVRITHQILKGDGLPTFALEAKCFHWYLTSFHLPGLHITPPSFCTKRYFCPNSEKF